MSEEPDKKLGDPNKNPWYVLATIFGEQPEGASIWDFDEELVAKNRRAWNGWYSKDLNEEGRQIRADQAGLDPWDFRPLTQEEIQEIKILFGKRMADVGIEKPKLPRPTEEINFSNLTYHRPINFEKFVFENHCSFKSAAFNRFTNFKSANFHRPANFGSVQFRYPARFGSVAFYNIANFSSVTFHYPVNFESVEFNHLVSFTSATFNHSTNFSSAKFKSTTQFSGAQFLTHVPEFHATQLYDDTVFSLPDNFTNNWPPISGTVEIEGRDEPTFVMPAAEQKRAYNRLRLFMSQSLQIDEEQYFHRMEMRCKAQTQSWPYRLLFSAYEAISDYGNSIWRPIGWLSIVWLAGACARLATIKAENIQSELPLALGAAFHSLGWSFANIFSFFGFQRRYFAGEELNWALNLLSATQTISGFVLLFLLGLGLRNRFRLR